jgi:mono/diheme cytochrome c family protein
MSRLSCRANPGSSVVRLLVGIAGALALPACGPEVLGKTTSTDPNFDGGLFSSPATPEFDPSVSSADPPPPISGGTLAVLKDGVTAVAADPDRDTVSIVELGGNNRLRATVQLQSHDEPGRLVEDGAGRVHVALRRGGALVTIDPQAGTILARRNVCAIPRGVAYDPATSLVHVACMDGQLVSLPAAGGAATRVVQLPRDLRDVVVDGNQLLVSRFRSAQVLTVDASGNVTGTDVPPTYSDSLVRGNAPFTPSTAWQMRAAPQGGALLLHQRGTTDVIDTTSAGGYGNSRDPCQALVHPALTPMGGEQSTPAAPPIPGMVLPVDFALSPDGAQVAVVAAGNSHSPALTTVFLSSRAKLTDGTFQACCPDGVHGPAAGPLGPKCIGTPMSSGGCPQPTGEVEAVSFDPSGRVVVQTREPATIQVPQAGITVSLSSISRADTGHEIFHANSGAGIACASCHGEGQEDGRIWNFDIAGARRTMAIAGGVASRAPYHWSGDLADFNKLMMVVYTGRMAGPPLTPDQLTDVRVWLNSLPALPGVVSDSAAVDRGHALFDDTTQTGCSVCHAGPQLTTDAVVDVGTGGTFKVPSLIGLAWTAPYLHDGCAATLADRFGDCGGGDRHGVTSTLTAAQKADLIAYLDSL